MSYQQTTSTMCRNIYSQGISYINVKFYGTNLSFQFAPATPGGKGFDKSRSLMTTVNWETAFALYQVAMDIINGREAASGSTLVIPCASGASLCLDRKAGPSGQMETFFVIMKNNDSIPFLFTTHTVQVKEGSQFVAKVVESGLGMFAKMLEGYLTGINSDRHLDKMTEDYVKSLNQEGGDQNQQFQTGSGYQNKGYSGGYKKGGWGNKKNWPNQQQPAWEPQQPNPPQAMSTYTLPQ